METKDIIHLLYALKGSYRGHAKGTEPTAMIEKSGDAVDAAIQAVELLDQIKATVKGNCKFCRYYAYGPADFPCCECFGSKYNAWEFRWPLGRKETTDETD